MNKDSKAKFCDEFLGEYMKLGIGSMPKSDIDALVLFLIDKYGCTSPGAVAQATYSNQQASETLRTPLSTIKRLRYQASLKFGGSVEEQVKRLLPDILKKAGYEAGRGNDSGKLKIMVENTLVKNWIHGQLKVHAEFFDTSFNTEIIKLTPQALKKILEPIIDSSKMTELTSKVDAIVTQTEREDKVEKFKELVDWLIKGAAFLI